MGGPYGSTTVAGLSGTSPQGQLVFGDDRSIRFVRPAGEGGFAPWVYNLRLAGGKGRPVAPPISTGGPIPAGGSEASGPTPEMRSSSDDGRERGAKPTESATPTAAPTPEAPPSGPSKPPEGGSSITSTVVSVEPTAGGGSKTVEVLRTSSGATSTKTTWRDADGKVVAVSDGPGPDQASGSEGEGQPTGSGGGGDGDGESVDHINSGEGNPGGMTDPDSPGASEGSPRRIQLPIVPSLADKFSRAMMELARASAGGGGTRTPWGGPTDGPSWTPFGPALAYGDPSEGGGGSGNGGSGDGWGEGPMFEGESAVPRRLPTPLERMRAGMNFGRWNTLPGDPPPVDLRTARMHTVDDDGPAGAINTSAHEMYLQRFVNPVARVATRRRG